MATRALLQPEERPLYTLAEAARYAGTSPQTAARWLRGYSYRTATGDRHSPRLTSGSDGRESPLTFYDLVELAVVAAARRANVTVPAIRRAVDYVRVVSGLDRPLLAGNFMVFAREMFVPVALFPRRLGSPGVTQFIGPQSAGIIESAAEIVNASRGGQQAFDYIREVLENLDYRDRTTPIRFWPAGRSEPIVIDPAISFGRPFVTSNGVSTEVIRDRFDAGEGIAELANDLSIPIDHAEAALRFEHKMPLAA